MICYDKKLPNYIFFYFILVVLSIVCSCYNSPAKEIDIGAILPLTGDASKYGQAIKNGIELANNELINAGSKVKFSIIYEDDQGKPSVSVSSLIKLIATNKLKIIIGGAMSSTAEPIIPITEREQIFLISPTATKASLTENTKYFFRLWPSDNYDGQIMAEAAYKKLGLRHIAILFVDAAYGQGIAEVFRREFEKLGGTIVGFESYSEGSTDYRTQIEKLKSTNPEAVYIPGYVKEVSILLRQCRELGFRTRFLGVNSLYDPQLLELAGEAAEGAVFTYPAYDKDSPNTAIKEFVQAYEAKYGTAPDVFAAQGYDSLRVLAKVIEMEGAGDQDKIRHGFLNMKNYEGPSGTVKFESTGDVARPLRLLTVNNGKFVQLK